MPPLLGQFNADPQLDAVPDSRSKPEDVPVSDAIPEVVPDCDFKPDPDVWLEILSWEEKCAILQEAYDTNSNASICQFECSFCGALTAPSPSKKSKTATGIVSGASSSRSSSTLSNTD